MFHRALEAPIIEALTAPRRKVVVLYGPRRVGKTTLSRVVMQKLRGRVELLNGDYADDRALLEPSRSALTRVSAGVDYLFIDEAQNVPGIGRILKLLHDDHPGVRVVATGSSSLDLARHSGEPLTGRQRVFILHPISYGEQDPRPPRAATVIDHGQLYGSYPEVLTLESSKEKVAHLRQLVADYLLKDVFQLVALDRPRLLDLLRLLALQIGSEVSLSELAQGSHLDVKTVARYLDVLEQAFVIVQLHGFSRNLRKEIAKARKIYFVDLGVRNAIVQAFQPLKARVDRGGLWENYLIVERLKRNAQAGIDARLHFWRTYDQQEIDLVEEGPEGLLAFEFKAGGRKARIPRLWQQTYPDSRVQIVTPDDLDGFLRLPSGG